MAQKLDKWSAGGTIKGVEILRGVNYLSGNQSELVCLKTISRVWRRGKYLVFDMVDGSRMVCHNAMSGFWDCSDDPWTFDYVEGKRKSTESDIRVKFWLGFKDGKERYLYFHDARLFGRLHYYDAKERNVHFRGVGPEVLTTPQILSDAPRHNDESFVNAIRSSKHTLKEILLKQSLLAGVGNIYAAESLWLAELSPFRIGTEVTPQEAVDLLYAIRIILMRALDRNLSYSELAIYRRKTCPKCSSKVLQHSIRGRSTYYCGVCQK
jgi:formamidopyrimidine-DNA glycosylase